MPRAAILLNGGSRSKRAARERERLSEILRSSRLQADLLSADSGAEFAQLARQAALSDHYDMIVAAGGDGTVNAVASAVWRANKDIRDTSGAKIMGVLPLGTVNHFAKTLRIPMDLAEAVQCLEEPATWLVDLGDVNGKVFVNNSTLGIYPKIVRYREHLRLNRRLNKWAAFAYAAARMVPGHEPERLRLTIDGARAISARTHFVFIGRSDGTLGSIDIIPDEKPGPGELSVFLVHARRNLLRLASRALAGKLSEAEGVETFRAGEIYIEGEARRLQVAMDGEVVPLPTPLHYRVRRRALRVAGPKREPEIVEVPSEPMLQEGG